MDVKVEKVDEANYKVTAVIDNKDIESKLEKIAKEASKTLKIDGFRKGKAPVSLVKKLYGKKLKEDAEAEVIREVLQEAYKQADIDPENVIGNPIFEKFEDKDGKKEMEIVISLKPQFDLGDYSDVAPEYEKPQASEEDINKEIEAIAERFTKFKDTQLS